MPPQCIDVLVDALTSSGAPMATLATPLPPELATDPNKVKVVLAADGSALYFSRATILFDRDRSGRVRYLLHLGVYAYRAGFLRVLSSLPATPAEQGGSSSN